MKIRFLMHNVFGPGGGVLTVVHNLAADLAARHDVELVSIAHLRREPIHPIPEGVSLTSLVDLSAGAVHDADTADALTRPSEVVPAQEPHSWAFSAASDRALQRYFDGVRDGVLVGMQPGVNLCLARWGRPEVVRVGQDHRPFQDRPARLRKTMVAEVGRLDAFLALTEADAAQWREKLGTGLHIGFIPNAAPPYLGEPSHLDARVVVAAGQLNKNKGFDLLIDAWEIVSRERPGWQLKIFGRGEQELPLEAQIQRLALGGSAQLMGYSTALMDEFAQASVFVLSSRAEGYAMVLLEAMSCGLAVVSFDCPTGPAAIIDHGRNGYLVPNGDVPALARQIIDTIDLGPQGRRPLADAGLRMARAQTQPAISARWEQLFSDLLAAKS